VSDPFETDTLPECDSACRTVEERFAQRITMTVPDKHNPRLHRVMELVNADGTVNLSPLRESQGERVGIGADGVVALTSEAGPTGGPASITILRCRLDGVEG